MPGICVVFVGLRRIPREGLAALAAARRAGYEVCHVGRQLPGWARPLVRESREADPFDRDAVVAAVLDLARRHDVRGVASFTEVDVESVARAADALGLPGLPPEAARLARNKWECKRALERLDAYLPRYARVHDVAELTAAVRDLGLPAVVKPTGASGSKGIFELYDERDLAPAMEHLQRIARPQYDAVFRDFGAEFIVEEYVTGAELSVEGFVQDGRVTVVAVTDKVTSTPFHLELRHVVPSGLPAVVLERVRVATGRIVAALGFDHCAFHLEGKVDGDRFTFIEVAARPAGDYIASHLVPLATGVDFFTGVVRLAVGAPVDVPPTHAEHAGIHFLLAEEAGRFEGLADLEPILAAPGYEHLFVEVPAGSDVRLPPEHFTSQRVAAVCARHPRREEIDRLLDEAVKTVRVRVAAR